MNLLEYTLSLQDQMSANLAKVGVNTEVLTKHLGDLESQAKDVDKVMKSTGGSTMALKRRLDLLKTGRDLISRTQVQSIQAVNREIQNLEKEIHKLENTTGRSRIGGWFRDAFNQIPFAGLLTNPLVIAGAIGGRAISLGIEQEMQSTSFEVLLGSEQAAKKMVDDIAAYAKKTPFGKMDLGDNAKTMLSFGIDENKIMPFLSAIGDVAMGDKNKMQSLSLAFSQMSSTGKLMGQDLLQMINAGFNPLDEISRKTGKSIGVLKEEMAQGKISAEMVQDAFMSATAEGGKFHGMADKMSQTLGGKLSTLMDNVNEKFLTFYNYISPVVAKVVDLGGAALDAASNGIGWFVQKLKDGHPAAVALVSILGIATTTMIIMRGVMMAQAAWTAITSGALWAQVVAWWNLNAAMYANPVGLVIAGVIALIAAISYLVYTTDGWGDMWENTLKAAESLWKTFTADLQLKWLRAEHIFLSGIEKIMQAWFQLKSLWDEEGAKAGLAGLQSKSNERQAEIAKQFGVVVDNSKDVLKYGAAAANSLTDNGKSFTTIKDSLMAKLGMSPSPTGIASPTGIPGTGTGEVASSLGGKSGKGANTKTNQAIATGGTKHNYVTVHLKDLIGILNINGKGFKESAKEMEVQLVDALLRVLAMANTAT